MTSSMHGGPYCSMVESLGCFGGGSLPCVWALGQTQRVAAAIILWAAVGGRAPKRQGFIHAGVGHPLEGVPGDFRHGVPHFVSYGIPSPWVQYLRARAKGTGRVGCDEAIGAGLPWRHDRSRRRLQCFVHLPCAWLSIAFGSPWNVCASTVEGARLAFAPAHPASLLPWS